MGGGADQTRFLALLACMTLSCARSTEPCTAAPLEVDFGELPAALGSMHERLVRVANPSDVDRVITLKPLTAPFSVDTARPLPLRAHSEAFLAVRFAALDGLLHFDELIVSGDDPACDLTIPIRALGSGLIRASPEKLEFTLGAGEMETKQVIIENGRRTPVTVNALWGAVGSESFSSPLGGSEIPPGGSVAIPIIAHPMGWEQVEAELHILGPDQPTKVTVSITPSSPRLEITPLAFDIPVVGLDLASRPPGFAERAVRVRNIGSSGDPTAPPLKILSTPAPFGDPDELQVMRPTSPVFLAEGESAELAVRLIPRFAGLKTLGFGVSTDRFDTLQVRLTALAQVLPPCELRVEPSGQLQLQDAADGGVEGFVTFTNTGAEQCVVDNLRLRADTPPQFGIVWPLSAQVALQPGREQRVLIAGPKSVDAGTIGAFGFHVFRANSDNEWVELKLGP